VAIFAFWYARSTNQATIDAATANLKDQGEQLDRTLAAQRGQLDDTLTAQREQLDKTLAAQRGQLDSTLAEQRTRTLNERFATAASQLGSDKPPAVRLAGVEVPHRSRTGDPIGFSWKGTGTSAGKRKEIQSRVQGAGRQEGGR
jgi:hypothetical protein